MAETDNARRVARKAGVRAAGPKQTGTEVRWVHKIAKRCTHACSGAAANGTLGPDRQRQEGSPQSGREDEGLSNKCTIRTP